MIGRHLIHIHHALKDLQRALADLDALLEAADGPVWLPEQIPPGKARKRARRTLSQLFHDDSFEPPLAGLLHVPWQAQAQVDAVNERKEALKERITVLRQEAGTQKSGFLQVIGRAGRHVRDPAVCRALESIKAQRLNLLWCYRRILVLPEGLESISWSWVSQRSLKRVSLDQAFKMAQGLQETARVEAERLLSRVPVHEPLVQVRPIASHLRANLVYGEKGKERRRMIVAPSVLLLPQAQLPRMRWPGSEPSETNRLARRDQKIIPDPYIHALRLHRYRENA